MKYNKKSNKNGRKNDALSNLRRGVLTDINDFFMKVDYASKKISLYKRKTHMGTAKIKCSFDSSEEYIKETGIKILAKKLDLNPRYLSMVTCTERKRKNKPQRKNSVEDCYRERYNQLRSKKGRLTYKDFKGYLPRNFIKREMACFEQGSYFLDFVIPVQKRAGRKCEVTLRYCNHDLQIHHLDSYQFNEDGRIDPDNAVALAPEVHEKFHELYGYKNNTRDQFTEFVSKVRAGEIQF